MEKSQTIYQSLGWDAGSEGWRKVGPVEARKVWATGDWFAECKVCHTSAYGGGPAQAVHYLAQRCSHLQATALGACKEDN